MRTNSQELLKPFKVGDFVIHPVYGGGDIVEIEEKHFSEKGVCLYYQIAMLKSTMWIPVDAQAALGLRLATTKSELDQYRNLLRDHPVPLSRNHAQRYVELASRVKEGSFQVICEVVRDLTGSSRQKRLRQSDAAVLRKTRERLLQEWATAADISITEASKEIDRLLKVTIDGLE
jgi:RNA polymerase-interacting CarD/CdnL/TRCF family regulator